MYCKICGDEKNVKFYPKKRQNLCFSCSQDTPKKVSRENFDAKYWGKKEEVSEGTKKSFYEDYLASKYTLKEYLDATIKTMV